MTISYYSFNVSRGSSNILSFIPDISSLCFLYFLICLISDYQYYFITIQILILSVLFFGHNCLILSHWLLFSGRRVSEHP